MGVEVGNRSIVGMNLRMNELSGAVALAQGRKLDGILEKLRNNKSILKNKLSDLSKFSFRTINDENECATLLTLIFDTKEYADKFCEAINSVPISHSGWHVYNNMEQILNKITATEANCPYDCPKYVVKSEYHKHMLPQTDSILDRAVNISIGVVDKGLGSGVGVNINSSLDDINDTATKIREIIESL